MRLVLMIMSLFVCCAVSGQYKGPKLPINDEWFWQYGSKGLQEGDRMPDVPLGTIINNKTGKKLFSDFKGKLVILDFWTTSCYSCIAGFPKMEQLQKEFGSKIQIFLVNVWETEQQIQEIMSRNSRQMPDLPCIVSNRSYSGDEFYKNPPPIYRHFPTPYVPHHVWIDGKGIIRLRGGAENTYAAKIKDLLAGKSIQVLKNSSTLPDLNRDRNARYYEQLGSMRKTALTYGSFITPYTNEVTGFYGANREIVDSVLKTRTSHFINQNLLDLYLKCFNKNEVFFTVYHKLLFSPSIIDIDFAVFPPGTDTLAYTSDPSVIHRPLTTEERIRSRYCYEQVLPLAISETERYQMMLEDLNRYFKVYYGITGSVQNRKVKYYELIRISAHDKIGVADSPGNAKIVEVDGKPVLLFQDDLTYLFPALLQNKNLQLKLGFLYDSDGAPFLIFNGTDWPRNKKVSLQISFEGLRTLSDLRQILQAYDLDLKERIEPLPFYVFARTDANN